MPLPSSPPPPLPVSLMLPLLSPPLSMALPSPSLCHHHRRIRCRRCHRYRCCHCCHHHRHRHHIDVVAAAIIVAVVAVVAAIAPSFSRRVVSPPPRPCLPTLFLCHILPLLIVECLPNQSYCPLTATPSLPTHPPSVSTNIPPTPSVFVCSNQ